MAKVLIVGCGDVGSRLAMELANAGHDVSGLRRSPFTLPGVKSLKGDVTNPISLQFPAALDYVFVLLAPGESNEAAYRRIYLEGTRHVLCALSGQQLRRIFWISSSSVYAQDDGSWVDENSPAQPESATTKILLEAEQLTQSSTWPITIVRFAGIYGPGRLRLLRWVREGHPVQAKPPLWTNRIHVDDCAGMLAFLLAQDESGRTLDDLYIGTDNTPAPQHEVLDWIADYLKLPQVPHQTLADAAGNKRLSNRRITEMGYRWCFPDYVSGYTSIIATSE